MSVLQHNTYPDVMVDLETFGTFMNAPVITIGACYFDIKTGDIGAKFYQRIDLADAMKFGSVDPETLRWWLTQAPEAQQELIRPGQNAATVLESFEHFCSLRSDIQVWANGPTFDVTMLDYQFNRVLGRKVPWKFWNVRCVRTIVELTKNIYPKPSEEARKGVAHNALDDCEFQIAYVSKMYQALHGKGDDLGPITCKASAPPADDELL